MRFLTLSTALAFLVACAPESTPQGLPHVNVPPVADLIRAADGTLDGRASWDPDGDADTVLTYHWSFDYQPDDSTLEASSLHPNHDHSGTTGFVPDAEGTWIVQLVVDDGEDVSEPAWVFFDTSYTDLPPVDAGPDQDVFVGDTVVLDGMGSLDAVGGALRVEWSLEKLPQASSLNPGPSAIDAPGDLVTSFVPDAIGLYVATLTLTDVHGASQSDALSIMATNPGGSPLADAGEDLQAEDCALVSLDGTGSYDPEGATLSWFWELQQRPDGSRADNHSFTDRTSVSPSFWPDVAGEYTLSLSVYDGSAWSSPDLLILDIAERSRNSTPEVDAGADRMESAGEAECTQVGWEWRCGDCDVVRTDLGLDALVQDDDDDPLVLSWISLDTQARLIHEDRVATEVVIEGHSPDGPGTCTTETYTFELSARDCPGAVGTDQVEIEVDCCGVK